MTPDDTPLPPRSPGAACPVCGKPMVSAHRPFCSARCRNIDLGRWLKGNYRIKTDDHPDDGADEAG